MSLLRKATLPSVGKQWHLTPHAFAMTGNFDYVNEGCIVLDDGTLWFIQPEMGGSAHLSFQDFDGAIGTIHPEGWIKWSGDHWTQHALGNLNAVAFADEYYIWDTLFPFHANFDNSRIFTTDGQYIYYSLTPVSIGSNPLNEANSGGRIYRLDPSTGLCTWIVGAAYESGTYTALDSHDGRLAQFYNGYDQSGASWTCDRDYIYWIEGMNVGSSVAGRVRRIKLEPPYPVDTIFESTSFPTTSDQWDIEPNGFPKRLQSDFLGANGSDTALVRHGDYLYIAHDADLRRMPIAGGPVENVIYGGKTELEDRFSQSSGWSHSPTRHWLGWISSWDLDDDGNPFILSVWDQPGIPDLEGLWVSDSNMKSVGNRIYFINNSGSEGSNINNWWGRRFAYFDMDVLLGSYSTNGPQKPNRANPQWKTISNGTALWEAEPSLNNTAISASIRQCGYQQNERAGPEPVHAHPGFLFDYNPYAVSPWNERIVFTHMQANFFGASDWFPVYSDPTQIGWGCSYLEEQGPNGGYNLSIRFTGDQLKGYAAARNISPPSAPEQVNLREVDG